MSTDVGITLKPIFISNFRIDPETALRFASQRYNLPNNPCLCVNPHEYNYDHFNRIVDGRTLRRQQSGACAGLDPFHNVNAILAREQFLLRPQFRYGVGPRGYYDTQNIARDHRFKSQMCQPVSPTLNMGMDSGAAYSPSVGSDEFDFSDAQMVNGGVGIVSSASNGYGQASGQFSYASGQNFSYGQASGSYGASAPGPSYAFDTNLTSDCSDNSSSYAMNADGVASSLTSY